MIKINSQISNSCLFLGEEVTGVHKSELITWYLNEIESTIENEQQLVEQNAIIEKIIYRLIHYVRLVIKFSLIF
jgi:hypothetical protein